MLEVIGASFGRTGTHSLAAALEILGFRPCYHMVELHRNPDHDSLWQDAIDGKPIDWQVLFQPYKSSAEWPVVAFLPHILPEFPEAKVILTHRDPEEWFESADATIFEALEISAFNPDPIRRERGNLARRLILDNVFAGRYRDKEYAIQVYQKHIAGVIEMVPSEQLLHYRITEGWEPLCRFLDEDEPEVEFPWVNERVKFMSTEPAWAREIRRTQRETLNEFTRTE